MKKEKRIRKPLTPKQREAKRLRDRAYRERKRLSAKKQPKVAKTTAKKPATKKMKAVIKERIALPKPVVENPYRTFFLASMLILASVKQIVSMANVKVK